MPVANRVGAEHQGFKTVMNNFNTERLIMAALACGYAEVCLEEAVGWVRQRHTFGTALSERQVVRHKLMDMTWRIDVSRTLVHELAYRIEHRLADPNQLVARICLAKVQAAASSGCSGPTMGARVTGCRAHRSGGEGPDGRALALRRCCRAWHLPEPLRSAAHASAPRSPPARSTRASRRCWPA